jgi:hypothetical protein
MSTSNIFIKAASAILDYKFDWMPKTHGVVGADTEYLDAGETILTAIVSAEAGLTVDSYSITEAGTSVSFWLSGGTKGVDYVVTCTITTSTTPRKDPRTMVIRII